MCALVTQNKEEVGSGEWIYAPDDRLATNSSEQRLTYHGVSISQRFETAWMLRRFSDTCYQFYSLGNMPPGLSWLIWPRDLVGGKKGCPRVTPP